MFATSERAIREAVLYQAAKTPELARIQNNLLMLPPQAFVFTGLQGSGKSTVAKLFNNILFSKVLRTDQVRKELVATPDYSIYETNTLYREIARQASIIMDKRRTVILDGTFSDEIQRWGVIQTLRETGYPVHVVLVQADENVILQRLAARTAAGNDISQATVDVYERRKHLFDIPENPDLVIDTTEGIESPKVLDTVVNGILDLHYTSWGKES